MNTPTSNEGSSSEAAAIVALEEKLTFQQRQLDQLNAVIVKQQEEIERLHREVIRLTQVMRGAFEHGGEDLPHEKPPHY